MKTLRMKTSHWFVMISHAQKCLPEECCGLAAGKNGLVSEIIPIENVLHSPIAFRMEAATQIREMVRIEKDGLDVLAIFHSHPEGPDWPSPRDVKEHFYPDSSVIILSRNEQEWSSRCFDIFGHEINEIELKVL